MKESDGMLLGLAGLPLKLRQGSLSSARHSLSEADHLAKVAKEKVVWEVWSRATTGKKLWTYFFNGHGASETGMFGTVFVLIEVYFRAPKKATPGRDLCRQKADMNHQGKEKSRPMRLQLVGGAGTLGQLILPFFVSNIGSQEIPHSFFLGGQIINTWGIFHCHVWFLDVRWC